MPLNTADQNPNTFNVVPAKTDKNGTDRGQCSWFERPMTGNVIGDRLRIVDVNMQEFVWNGTYWANPLFVFNGAGELVGLVAGLDNAVYTVNRVLHQSAIPVGIPSGGTMADNGRVTLTTALPLAYTTGIYLYFPSAAVYAASPAGFYYVIMDSSSQTVGTVYNNIYVPGVTPLAIPATPTPITLTGPGAFTGSQSAIAVAMATVPAGALGKDGRLDFQFYGSNNNTAGQNKIFTLHFGGQQLHSQAQTTAVNLAVARFVMANRGREDRQVSSNTATNGTSSAAPLQFSVDTTVDQLVEIRLQHSSSATDVIMLECSSIVLDVS